MCWPQRGRGQGGGLFVPEIRRSTLHGGCLQCAKRRGRSRSGGVAAVLRPRDASQNRVRRRCACRSERDRSCIGDTEITSVGDTARLTVDGRSVAEHLATDFRGILAAQQLGNVKPSAPVHSAHSYFDDLLPQDQGLDLSRRWCRPGATVQFDSLVSPGHNASALEAGAHATVGTTAQVAGAPAPNNCAFLP
ncbi:lipase family protein [Microbacterium oleivorans]